MVSAMSVFRSVAIEIRADKGYQIAQALAAEGHPHTPSYQRVDVLMIIGVSEQQR
jgi:hypothetical protein